MNTLTLANFKGLLISEYNLNSTQLFIVFTILDFYLDIHVIINDMCEIFIYETVFKFSDVFLSTGTKFANKYCIEAFGGKYLQNLYIEDMTNTFIRKNYFEFIKSNQSNNTNFNSSIKSVIFEMYYLNADEKILNEILFVNIEVIYFKGIINSISTELFKPFRFKILYLELFNLRQVLHRSSDSFKSIYIDDSSTEREKRNIQILSHDRYNFPDNDYCLIKKFPIIKFQHLFFK